MPNQDTTIEFVTKEAQKVTINELHMDIWVNNGVSDVDCEDGVFYAAEGDVVSLTTISPIDFDYPCVLLGAYVNRDYIEAEYNDFGQPCVNFTMPNEQVEISLVFEDHYTLTIKDSESIYVYDEDLVLVDCIDSVDGLTVCTIKKGYTVEIFYPYRTDYGVINGVMLSGENATFDSENSNQFTLCMPAEDVIIEPTYAYEIRIDDSIRGCDIWYYDDNMDCIYWDGQYIRAGQKVHMSFEGLGLVNIIINDGDVEFTIDEKGYSYDISFIMPAEDILIEALYDDTHYTITVDSDYGAAIHSSALVNEFVDLVFEHVPGHIISSITINGIDITEFNGDDRTDRFYMPAENVVIKVTYEETDEEYEELTFEADIKFPSEGFGGDYETIVKLPENVSNAMPEELRNDPDFPAIIWLASDGAFPALTFESIEDFLTLYTMEYDGVFSEDYNYGAIIAVATDKNYAFARGTIIINGKEVPATLLSVDIGEEDIFGTIIFFEFELAEFVEEEVDLQITVENMPSVGETFYEYMEIDEWDGYYESKIDFELPIDGNYEIEEFIWLHTDSSFPEINNYEDFSELLGLMLDYDAVITSEGKYAVLMAVTVEYGTTLNEGIAVINGQTVSIKLIYPEDLETATMSNGNTVFVLIEFEISDEGTMVPAAIIDNEKNPDTGDRSYISIYLSLLVAIVIIGTATVIAKKKSRKTL